MPGLIHGPLFDFIMLALLVVFFGVEQRHRPQMYFRLWFAGWVSTLLGLIVYASQFLTTAHPALRHCLEKEFLFAGGVAFLFSFLPARVRPAQTLAHGLALSLPAVWLFNFCSLDRPAPLPILLAVVVLETGYLVTGARMLSRQGRGRRIALNILAVSTGVAALMLTVAGHARNIEDWMVFQVFVSAGILYAATGKRWSLEWWVGLLGLVAWGLSYLVGEVVPHYVLAGQAFWELWNLPKYALGFAMTLRIFESARADVVRLAQQYKGLYADFRLLYESHPLPMWIYDAATGVFLSVNTAATKSYGYTEQEFLQLRLDQIFAGEASQLSAPPPEHSRRGTVQTSDGTRTPGVVSRAAHRRKDGTRIYVELTEDTLVFQGREARVVLAVDITERERLNQELYHRAQHDALTGLPNRLFLDDRIQQVLYDCAREHRKAVLFTIDADRFKLINDTYGHLTGDETLKAIAERLKERIRPVDTIARTGGEEFTAIVGGLNSLDDAEKVAAMLMHLFDAPLQLPAHDLKISVSVGAAVYPDDGEDAETLRRKSDQALYHAKRSGRNRYAFASSEVCASFDQAVAVELGLREALRNDAFALEFQPIFDENGCTQHFEALIRMTPQNATVYQPSLFIPIAEESGLILPLGEWVIERSCRHLEEWKKLGAGSFRVAINVSGKQLLQKDFGDFVLNALERHGLTPAAIQLELTETSLMSEPATMRDSMEALAAKGIQFAIDDFGTGYSSLARLVDLPIAMIKVDRSFISQLETSERSDGIVTAIVQMAQTLQVQVVAEGVENEAQLNLLLRRGCDLFQGYYLARPMRADHLAAALEDPHPMLFDHPHFSQTRVAVSKRVRRARMFQFPSLAGTGTA